jgi:4-phosphopantoate--beta-alanine ligase
MKIPESHPRAESLRTRDRLINGYRDQAVALAGLIAHGRGEAFDYLLGEKTTPSALKAIEAASALMLSAKNPVISVNGNVAVLSPNAIVELAETIEAKIEINLFYRSFTRLRAIKKIMEKAGAKKIFGVDEKNLTILSELDSERRKVDTQGILIADVVLVPLEDGDRTEALVEMGKKVIAIDLNPLSRTSEKASITIVDNIERTIPILTEKTKIFKFKTKKELDKILQDFNNSENLGKSLEIISKRLMKLACQRRSIEPETDYKHET